MKALFSNISLDTKVADTPASPNIDLKPLLDFFGQNVTWRTVIRHDIFKLQHEIKGYGRKAIQSLQVFINDNISYTFEDFL